MGEHRMAYTGRTFIREREFYCGDRLDIDLYTVWQGKGKRRKKCKPTREVQQKLNERKSQEHMIRLVLENFTDKDLALHLTYREGCEPATEEEVERDVHNYYRRVRRYRKKLGLPDLKYMWRWDRGEERGRVHIHMFILGGVDRDTLEELWGKGFANSKRLQFENGSVEGLAVYMGKNKKSYRRWNGSRNLKQPEPRVQDGKLTVEQMETVADAVEKKTASILFEEMFPGYELDVAEVRINSVNRQMYISVSMRKKQKGRKAPARKSAGAIAAFLNGEEW